MHLVLALSLLGHGASTLFSAQQTYITEIHVIDLPGTMATVFKALRTRKVRKALRFPKLTNIVTYLQDEVNMSVRLVKVAFLKQSNRDGGDTHAREITTKSNQFHGSRRYVNCSRINPRAIILINDSKV